MIALGLLAQNPSLREQVMGDVYKTSTGKVRVVSFSGRESEEYGIWGSIARQVGKFDSFRRFYAPLDAPGQSDWVNLLSGDPVLILLDELPPYLDYLGKELNYQGKLLSITTRALANLFVAAATKDLSNVCIVVSDLNAAYEAGSEQISNVFRDLEHEAMRSAKDLDPVRINTDEVYQILAKRIFLSLPGAKEAEDVATAYGKALKEAIDSGMPSSKLPETLHAEILTSYPFHPSIKDLYARFRENSGFMQTRGLIRYMGTIVSRLYESGRAKELLMVHPYDMDLNCSDVKSVLSGINPKLDNAIVHDIANEGRAVAEEADGESGKTETGDLTRLILVSSLANVQNAALGLPEPEIVYAMARPGRRLDFIRPGIEHLKARAWYFHSTPEGVFLFKDVQNLAAKINTYATAMPREVVLDHIKARVKEMFAPDQGDVYQELSVFPAPDEIRLEKDRVLLVVALPRQDDEILGLSSALKKSWEQATWKNRLAVLTGSHIQVDRLMKTAALHRATGKVCQEIAQDRSLSAQALLAEATERETQAGTSFFMALSQLFTLLYYPYDEKLVQVPLVLQLDGTPSRGEGNIRAILVERRKFADESMPTDTLGNRFVERLFTQEEMPYKDILERAAYDTHWIWHVPDRISLLVRHMINRGEWRWEGAEEGRILSRKPVVQTADVAVKTLAGNLTESLKVGIKALNGDTVHYAFDHDATPEDPVVPESAKSAEGEYSLDLGDRLRISLLCVDSKGKHLSSPARWHKIAEPTLAFAYFTQSFPVTVDPIFYPENLDVCRFTTDGSDPEKFGKPWNGPLEILQDTLFRFFLEKDGISSNRALPVEVAKRLPEKGNWTPASPIRLDHKARVYQLADAASARKFLLRGLTLGSYGKGDTAGRYVEVTLGPDVEVSGEGLGKFLSVIRETLEDPDITLLARNIRYSGTESLEEFCREMGLPIPTPDEVKADARS
jgi:hypothetical protein